MMEEDWTNEVRSNLNTIREFMNDCYTFIDRIHQAKMVISQSKIEGTRILCLERLDRELAEMEKTIKVFRRVESEYQKLADVLFLDAKVHDLGTELFQEEIGQKV